MTPRAFRCGSVQVSGSSGHSHPGRELRQPLENVEPVPMRSQVGTWSSVAQLDACVCQGEEYTSFVITKMSEFGQSSVPAGTPALTCLCLMKKK
ncbi:hypothetical protein E2C01_028307 [Portunus trituberculatus]|uniref:Uncharacterized protein n=1 Tax=Portunus trituberculatus TaxID=210409 RepID=A0A5B7ERA9_PORTR|nr:hypothetical protein [Portunus trituberculatus]